MDRNVGWIRRRRFTANVPCVNMEQTKKQSNQELQGSVPPSSRSGVNDETHKFLSTRYTLRKFSTSRWNMSVSTIFIYIYDLNLLASDY